MRFNGLDLNLLVALDVLLDERSVSRAAERLNLSQPALSAALARLRDYFGDPLLVPQGRRMIPSAQALSMQDDLKAVLGAAGELVVRSTGFDPATSQRVFRICVSDYLVAVLFARLIPELARSAPSVGLDLVPPSEGARTALDRGELDLLLTPEEHCVPGHPTELLFAERHVVAGWKDNPLLTSRLTEQAFYAAGHVAVRVGQVNRASFAESQLDVRPRKRKIEIVAASFTTVPDLLVGTGRLAVMHRRLARVMAGRVPIAWQELPFDFPEMREMIQFNRTRGEDRGLAWFVRQLHAAAD
jgi:LysR family nod box-dependent transcriptional activator